VNELELPDLYEAAARATINERCALAYLHDVRGSMQALFSALELLGRSAKSGNDNAARVERAYDLARRAISHHEKSTLGVLRLLTLQHAEAAVVDPDVLVREVVHFLRNEAATREVTVTISSVTGLGISTELARFHTLLVGLVTAAIDATPAGAELPVSIGRRENYAVISIGSDAGYGGIPEAQEPWCPPRKRLHQRELTLLFARQFMAANGGRLEIHSDAPRGTLRLYYPCLA
jgi:signal transduction histidine kinase